MPSQPGRPTTVSRWRALPRAAVAAVALLAATLLAASLPGASAKANADDAVVTQPFAADSTNPAHGDACPMGFARGLLGWHAGSQTVEVQGTVADRPLPGDPPGACGEDGHVTLVYFTGYAAGASVSQIGNGSNNGVTRFPGTFALHASRPIERVTVQVCRGRPSPPSFPPPPPFTDVYCGSVQTYASPATAG